MAQLVEHIVHIDGVTGSSPVATTKIPGRKAWGSFCPTTTPGIAPGVVVVALLCLVSVLCQAAQQIGIVWAGQYAVPIQGIFPDSVGR